jgi:hypothetical protein
MLPKIPNRKLYDLLEITHQNCGTSRPNWKLHGIDVGPYQKKENYHETVVTSPHAKESEIDQF